MMRISWCSSVFGLAPTSRSVSHTITFRISRLRLVLAVKIIPTGPVIVHMSLSFSCISNRPSFIKRTYGTNSHAIRSSSSTFANLSWRHTSFTHPFPINPSNGHPNVRAFSWASKFNLRPPGSLNDSDLHEEAAKSAVLEAIKGRQQTDLMLRCESNTTVTSPLRKLAQFYSHVGTVLDADGTRNAIRSYTHPPSLSSSILERTNHAWLYGLALDGTLYMNDNVSRVFLRIL
jgi:hypothetical protein